MNKTVSVTVANERCNPALYKRAGFCNTQASPALQSTATLVQHCNETRMNIGSERCRTVQHSCNTAENECCNHCCKRIAHTLAIPRKIPTSCCIAMGSQCTKPICFRRLRQIASRAYTFPYTRNASDHPIFTSERKLPNVR
jgi:hypothetical protein